MSKPLTGRYTSADHSAHVERQGERMRDETELDNLQADIRQSRGRELQMPWRTGRPLRSAGMGKDGNPISPLANIKLDQLTTPTEQSAMNRELDRVVLHDQISEGVLDQAERQGVPLLAEDQWWETDAQAKADEAEVAAKLKEAEGAD